MTTKVKCPTCGTQTALKENPYRPFCSEKCKMIDLGSWADEKYALPGEDLNADDVEYIQSHSEEKKTFH